MSTFSKTSRFDVPLAALFDWHVRPGAYERLVPPWERFEVVAREGGVADNGRVIARVKIGPVWWPWIAQHRDFQPNVRFVDDQVRGPFRRWTHSHQFAADGDGSTLEDAIEFETFAPRFAARKITRSFAFRHERLKNDLARHAAFAAHPRLRVAISGGSGLVGTALAAFLSTGGHDVLRLQRGVHWNPEKGTMDTAALEGVDAVVHLSGTNIAGARWNELRKDEIVRSRLDSTRLIVDTICRLQRPPRVLVSASATGFYGDRGDEPLTEESPPGRDYLADLCRRWEGITDHAKHRGIRVVNLRLGVVLSAQGGALPRMLTPFSMGVGGVLGGGRQYMAWIGHDDAIYAIHHALLTGSVSGPVLCCTPEANTNRDLTKALGRVLRRPTILPMPAFAARLAFGEVADALLLSSQRCTPLRLAASGFTWTHPTLESALRFTLGR